MLINIAGGTKPVEVDTICFSDAKQGTILMKYGSHEDVFGWYVKARVNFFGGGFVKQATELKVIDVEEVPEEEICKMIEISGYIGKFLKKHNISTYAKENRQKLEQEMKS